RCAGRGGSAQGPDLVHRSEARPSAIGHPANWLDCGRFARLRWKWIPSYGERGIRRRLLVPKLCLGTSSAKLRFASSGGAWKRRSKTVLRGLGSKTEFGNEETGARSMVSYSRASRR